MFFDSEFVSRVEEKPIEGLVEACDLALAKLEKRLRVGLSGLRRSMIFCGKSPHLCRL